MKNILKDVFKEFKVYTTTTQQELDRKRHLDATIASDLSEHPLYAMTPRSRMRAYLRQKLGFGLRDRAVRSRYGEMFQNVEKYVHALQDKLRTVRMSKGKNLQLHKELITLKDVEGWSRGPLRLKNLPTLFVTLMQTHYSADINAWKHAEEERFERGGN